MYRVYENDDGLKILLPEAIYKKICKMVTVYYPNECGGIFVGKIINEGGEAIIEYMRMPKQFKSNRVLFRRVAGLLNKWLHNIFNQSDGNLIYLGEWHSHPDGVPNPSLTDFLTMKSISSNSNVRIETPLLLIVAYNKGFFDEKFYVYTKNKLIQYGTKN